MEALLKNVCKFGVTAAGTGTRCSPTAGSTNNTVSPVVTCSSNADCAGLGSATVTSTGSNQTCTPSGQTCAASGQFGKCNGTADCT